MFINKRHRAYATEGIGQWERLPRLAPIGRMVEPGQCYLSFTGKRPQGQPGYILIKKTKIKDFLVRRKTCWRYLLPVFSPIIGVENGISKTLDSVFPHINVRISSDGPTSIFIEHV